MRIPKSPPELANLLREAEAEDLVRILSSGRTVNAKGRYLHWDDLQFRTPPSGLTHAEWWLGMTLARQGISRQLPLVDNDGIPFQFCNTDEMQEMLHRIDQQASGQILASDDSIFGVGSSRRYLVSSLVEEAITSSQLEGASTTRQVAKELLESGRRPRDLSEQMIRNNYDAMMYLEENVDPDEPLSVSTVLNLHRIVTSQTLEDEDDAGRLQTVGESRVGVYYHDELVHSPPPADQLPARLEQLCLFANGQSGEGFIHPVVRAIVLHFWLAYDHPFADGNGRTARALFYWSMLHSDYWLAQYLSISSVLRKAPAQYARSFLHVETDSNDLTYFILHQLQVIENSIDGLQEYLLRKSDETEQVQLLVRGTVGLNHRQVVLIGESTRDMQAVITIQSHAHRHRVTYQTARTDLLGLADLGLFHKSKVGKKFVFGPEPDISEQLEKLRP